MESITIILCSLLVMLVFLCIKLYRRQKKYKNQIALLKEVIKTRTTAFENSNGKISEYAYMNAHKVRGPLARILGMVHLIDIHSVSADEGYERIKEAAVQLDDVIRAINISLEKQNDILKKIADHPETPFLKKLA